MIRLICKQGVKDVDVEDTKHNLVSPESAMFSAHLSHFGMLISDMSSRGSNDTIPSTRTNII